MISQFPATTYTAENNPLLKFGTPPDQFSAEDFSGVVDTTLDAPSLRSPETNDPRPAVGVSPRLTGPRSSSLTPDDAPNSRRPNGATRREPSDPATVQLRSPDGNYTTVLSGGLWAAGSTRSVSAEVLGATPTLAHPELRLESVDYARKLAAGSTVQSLLGEHPTQDETNAMQDAFELLGISNRQISLYALKSAEGGYNIDGAQTLKGKTSQATLVVAGRMRAAVDGEGPRELHDYRYTVAGETFGDTSLADEFSTNGMIMSVENGVFVSRKYFQPKTAANDMIFGRTPNRIAQSKDSIFPDQFFHWDTYGAYAKVGAAALATVSVAIIPPPGGR